MGLFQFVNIVFLPLRLALVILIIVMGRVRLCLVRWLVVRALLLSSRLLRCVVVRWLVGYHGREGAISGMEGGVIHAYMG